MHDHDRSRRPLPGAGAALRPADSVPGRTTLVQLLPDIPGAPGAPPDIEQRLRALVGDPSRGCDDVAALVMRVPLGRRVQLYAAMADQLPAAAWPVAPDFKPRLGAGRAYLDELFHWATSQGATRLELARRCLEARYGLERLATSRSGRLRDLGEIEDLYTRIPTLDAQAVHAIMAATRANADPERRQAGHGLEEVLHGVEQLRAHLGTAIDLHLRDTLPDGPGDRWIRTVRVELVLPAKPHDLTHLTQFLDTVTRHNRQRTPAGKPAPQVRVDLLLSPDMRAYGMGFAQLEQQQTIGVAKSNQHPDGEARLDGIGRFKQKVKFMLTRAARNRGHPVEKIPELAALLNALKPLTNRTPKATLDAIEAAVLAQTAEPAAAKQDRTEWNDHYADVGKRFGHDSQQVRDHLAGYAGVIGAIELGNEPQVGWVVAEAGGFPGTEKGRHDMITQVSETSDAAFAELGPQAEGPTILNAAPQWDPATESTLLSQMAKNKQTDYKPGIRASQFYKLVQSYVTAWLAHNPGKTTVPLAIHVYNNPAFDAAMLDVLAELAQHPPVHLDLYITEFQVDADAGAGPGSDARQTDGLVAAGVNIELAVERNQRWLSIRSMLAWSYTKVDKSANGKLDKHYELDHNPSIDQLFGR